jgi:hypothetical protein
MKLTGSETFDFFGREITVANVEQILAKHPTIEHDHYFRREGIYF